MTKTKIIIVLLLCVSICSTSHAQTTDNTTKVLSGYVNLNDSAGVYRALYDNTPIEPEFKLAPKFAIIGADNRFVFSVGASMKFTTSYDWGNPVRNPQGMGPSDISPTPTPDNHLLQMSAGGSGIYFNIIGFPNTANEIGLFISLGLDSNNTYRLSAGQVYMRYRDFQCGYATSLYNDRRADAYIIDSHGPCASGAYSTVGMNWQHYFTNHVRVGLGIEMPKASYTQMIPQTADNIDQTVSYLFNSNQYTPNLPVYIGYNWGSGHVRLSSMLRNTHYINLNTGKGQNAIGTGVKLTGNATAGNVNIYWMGQVGRGSASSFRDNSDAGIDLVPDDKTPGRLQPTKSWGLICGAQWNITPKVFVTAMYSYLCNNIPHYSIAAVVERDKLMRRGFTTAANAVWKISPLFSTGIEYRHAHRYDESGISMGNNRIYGMLLMNF